MRKATRRSEAGTSMRSTLVLDDNNNERLETVGATPSSGGGAATTITDSARQVAALVSNHASAITQHDTRACDAASGGGPSRQRDTVDYKKFLRTGIERSLPNEHANETLTPALAAAERFDFGAGTWQPRRPPLS